MPVDLGQATPKETSLFGWPFLSECVLKNSGGRGIVPELVRIDMNDFTQREHVVRVPRQDVKIFLDRPFKIALGNASHRIGMWRFLKWLIRGKKVIADPIGERGQNGQGEN
jgi:hypothetical protein